MPYLREIDAHQHYANRGPLVDRLELRLQAMIACPGCAVLTAASGTAALQAAILAQAGRATPERPYALMPGYTFVATAMAAEACGYRPVFVDIDAATWAAAPAGFAAHPALARAGVVLAVAPYGRGHDQLGWAAFARAHGVAVVIDAAASFEALVDDPAGSTGEVPVVLSFHATKSFATGEGGAVIWSDIAGLQRCAQALNFGFLFSRSSRSAGFNGKMSEYHAAVGLAGLDGWAARAAGYRRVNTLYRAAAVDHGVADIVVVGPVIASNYAMALASSVAEAAAMVAALRDAAIEHRFWYGHGVHREPYFASGAVAALPETESVAARLIGIPIYPEIEPASVTRIVRCLASVRA